MRNLIFMTLLAAVFVIVPATTSLAENAGVPYGGSSTLGHSTADHPKMAQMGDDMGGMMMKGKGMGMDSKHYEMVGEMIGMLKETMTILKGLNHKPSSAEKKRLGEMIGRLGEIEMKHKKIHEMKGMK